MGKLRDRIGPPISEEQLVKNFVSEGWPIEHARDHARYIKLQERQYAESEAAYWLEQELICDDEHELFRPCL